MTLTPDPHPTAVQLARWLDGELDDVSAHRVATHYTMCLLCQTLTTDATPPLAAADDHTAAALAAESPRISDSVLTALAGPRNADPAPGELWRLEWDGYVTLAVVLDIEGEDLNADVLVAPVTTDIEAADQYTLIVGAERSPLEVPIAVWAALRTHVPRFTLDLSFGLTDLTKDAEELQRHFFADTTWTPYGEHLAVGLAIVSAADARWSVREAVAAVITELSEAGERLQAANDAGPLGDLAQASGVTAREVAERLELSPNQTYELLWGHIDVSTEEATALAELLDVPVERVSAHQRAPVAALHLAWSTPTTRDKTAQVAMETGRSLRELRQAGTAHVYAQAARETGTAATGLNAWEALVHAWLDSQT